MNHLYKKLLILLLFITNPLFSFSQTTIELGTWGTSISDAIPIHFVTNYSYTQTIYTAHELSIAGMSSAGEIDKIRYKPTTSTTAINWDAWEIHIGNTTKIDFSTITDWEDINTMTLVFDDTIQPNVFANQWMEIEFTTPFAWDGTSNIVIAIKQKKPYFGGTPNWAGYTDTLTGLYKGIYWYDNPTEPNIFNPPNAIGLTNTLPLIQLDWTNTATACSGIPTINIIEGPTEVCDSATFTLITNSFQDINIIYQWQSSPTGQNIWSDIIGATFPVYEATLGITTDSDFRVIATCTNSNQSDTSLIHTVQVKPVNECYCVPPSSFNANDSYWIESVFTTGALNNFLNLNTGFTPGGYIDYSGLHSVVTTAGADFDMEVHSNDAVSTWLQIWIDWNQNGIFDSDELVYSSNVGTPLAMNTHNVNIQVPSNAIQGTAKMRIRNYNDEGPCDYMSNGETEDYSIIITPIGNCNTANAGTIYSNKTHVCADENFILSASGASVPDTGIIYQWQTSPTGQGIWTDIPNANSLSYTGTGVNGITDFRLKVNCTFGNLEDTSNIITIYPSPVNECYCIPPTPSSSFFFWISDVSTTGGLSNFSNLNTSSNSIGYVDYTNTYSVITFAGGDFDLEVSIQNNSPPGIIVWIDWNQNGVFEPNEIVYSTTSGVPNNVNTYNTNIQVPSNVTPGTTRMRIRNNLGTDPCAQYFYGETEDYSVVIIGLNDCYDANAGTIISTPPLVCLDEGFTLTSTGYTVAGNGLSFQWQSSPAGQNTWSDIAGANNTSYSSPVLNAPTDYRLIAQCSLGNLADTSNIVTVDFEDPLDCYCLPTYAIGCTSGELISNVTLHGFTTSIDNNSQCSPLGYGDYTNLPAADLIPGMLYDLSVSTTYPSPNSTFVSAWIDWNQNGIFEPNEEIINTGTGGVPLSGTYTESFVVPSNLSPGDYRMRVRLNWFWGSNMDPCNLENYGEAEDYTVSVISVANCSGTPAIPIISGPIDICASTAFDVTSVGVPELGITYQWQSSPAGQNTWSDIPGAIYYNLHLANGIPDETDFRLITTCLTSNQSSTSNIITIDITPAVQCHCIPLYYNSCEFAAKIDGVSTSMGAININNTGSGCNELDSLAYSDFSDIHKVHAFQGLPIDIQVDVSFFNAGVKVWVDWNQNGIFEPSELVSESTGLVPAGITYIDTFTVPSNAALGFTKMRVRAKQSSTLFDPCGYESYGEAEDYGFVVLPIVYCSGTPDAGNINGPNTVCPNTPFDLEINPILETGIEYQWQESPIGQNLWTNIIGATGNIHSFPNGINAETDYRAIITCTNSNQSDTSSIHSIDFYPPLDCYCIPEYDEGCDLGYTISNVTLIGETIDLNNSTGCSSEGYGDYRGLVNEPDLSSNESYNLSVSTAYSNPFLVDVRAWIDWNENGIYDADEEIINSNGLGMDNGTYTEAFTVPSGVPIGTYNMRVRLVYTGGANIDPCSNEFYGEAEDYTIFINSFCENPIVDLGPDTTICSGESIVLDAGNPGLEYEWNTNSTSQTITVNQSGTYIVTVYDGNCSTIDSISVTVLDLPVVSLGDDKLICEGDTITLDAGNPGADYLWNDNSINQTLDVTQEDTYYVTVTDGNCSETDTVNVSFYPEPTADGIIVNEVEECTYMFNVQNPSTTHQIEWDFGDGSVTTIGAITSHNYTENGHYTVTVTIINECGEEVILTEEIICEGIGIKDLKNKLNVISLYPNPTTESITLESKTDLLMETITIYNILGQVVYENVSINAIKHIVDVAQLSSGLYTARIGTKHGFVNRKFEIIK